MRSQGVDVTEARGECRHECQNVLHFETVLRHQRAPSSGQSVMHAESPQRQLHPRRAPAVMSHRHSAAHFSKVQK